LPAGEAPALQIIVEASLGAFFVCCWLTAQMREDFAGEMERASDQNRIRFLARKIERFANR
jgi:hypothetical protein